jgi:hypothetical protein
MEGEFRTLLSAIRRIISPAGKSICLLFDEELIEKCRRERRGLVSLDLDFANPLRFQPSQYYGIAVLRLPSKPGAADLTNLIQPLSRTSTG